MRRILLAFAIVTFAAWQQELQPPLHAQDPPPQVYLHIGDQAQMTWASSVARRLREAGYDVPDIRLVPQVPDRTDIRYIRPEERTGAETIASHLLEDSGVHATLNYIGDRFSPTRLEVFELWFSGDEQIIAPVSGTDADLFDDRPNFIGLFGEKVGAVTQYDQYRVLETHDIPYFFTFDRWVRIQPVEALDESYWARWGRVDAASEAFQVVQ